MKFPFKPFSLTILLWLCVTIGYTQVDTSISALSSRNGYTPVVHSIPKGKLVLDLGVKSDTRSISNAFSGTIRPSQSFVQFPKFVGHMGVAKNTSLFAEYSLNYSEFLIDPSWDGNSISVNDFTQYEHVLNIGIHQNIIKQKGLRPSVSVRAGLVLLGYKGYYGATSVYWNSIYVTGIFNYEIGHHLEFGGSLGIPKTEGDSFRDIEYTATLKGKLNSKCGMIVSFGNVYDVFVRDKIEIRVYSQIFKKMRLDIGYERLSENFGWREHQLSIGLSAQFF